MVSAEEKQRFEKICIDMQDATRANFGIGTYSEKTVHRVLKTFLCPDTDYHEVGIGSFVTVFMVERGTEVKYHIVGSYETDPEAGKISDQSPIGAALIGKRAGDVAEAELPNGKTVHLELRDVHR